MSTNQTIDGVPRATIAAFAKVADAYSEAEDDSYEPWQDAMMHDELRLTLGQFRELRTLLDAPEVLVVPLTGPKEWLDSLKPAAQPRGEPVAEVYRGPASGISRIRWIDYKTAPVGTKLYAEQPAPVAADEMREFSKWTHEVIAESRIGGVTLKVQRMQHLTPGEEKSAHDAWMARAALNTKSR